MKLCKIILSVVTGSCIVLSAVAQEHPDVVKLVEDTSDNVAVSEENMYQNATYSVEKINMDNFNYDESISSQMSDITQNTQDQTTVLTEQDNLASVAVVENDTEKTVESIAVKQLKGSNTNSADILNSILPIDSLPPIVPEDIALLLEEEQPDPAQVKKKIAEVVLIDKSKPEQLYATQDLQNRLVAAGVMRALDNAKRSFELSAKAQQEIDEDRQKVEAATTFTGVLSATASTTVHSYQKLNEIKGLYAQMMELDALGSLRGAELTAEEREKRAQEATGKKDTAAGAITRAQETKTVEIASLEEKADKYDRDVFYACLKSTAERKAEVVSNYPGIKEITKKQMVAKIQNALAQAETKYQEYKTCQAQGREYCYFHDGDLGTVVTGVQRQECLKKAYGNK